MYISHLRNDSFILNHHVLIKKENEVCEKKKN